MGEIRDFRSRTIVRGLLSAICPRDAFSQPEFRQFAVAGECPGPAFGESNLFVAINIVDLGDLRLRTNLRDPEEQILPDLGLTSKPSLAVSSPFEVCKPCRCF